MNKQLVLESLENQLKQNKEHNREVYQEAHGMFMAQAEDIRATYFSDFSAVLKLTEDNLYFYGDRKDEGTFNDEMFQINFNNGFGSRKRDYQPYINYYTTQANNDFQLKRLVMLGKLSERFQDKKIVQDIIQRADSIKVYIEEKSKDVWNLEAEINKLKREIEEEKFEERLKIGIVYEGDDIRIDTVKMGQINMTKLEVIKISPKTVVIKTERKDSIYGDYEMRLKKHEMKQLFRNVDKVITEKAG